jgi:hypothetical protein
MYITRKPNPVYGALKADLGGFGEMSDTQRYLLIGGIAVASVVASVAVQYWWLKVQAKLMAEAFQKKGRR